MTSNTGGVPDRLAHVATALAAVLLLAAGAQGLISWESNGTLEVRTIVPPTHFEKGDNADDNRWMKSFTLSQNKTSFDAEVKPRPGAKAYIQNVTTLNNADDESRSITLTGSQVTNSKVEQFEWEIVDGGGQHVATLDHLTADPSASFSLPAGTEYRMDLEIDLADGAGRVNAGISFTVQLEVT